MQHQKPVDPATNHQKVAAHALLGLLCCAAMAASVQAQATAEDNQNIENMRTIAPRAGDDLVIDNWFKAELAGFDNAGNDPLLAATAGRDFVQRVRKIYEAEDTSEAFRQTFAQRAAPLLSAALKDDPPPAKARSVAQILAVLGAGSTRDAMLTALNSTDQVARFHAARALQRIEADIAANQQLTPPTLNAIAARGAVERNGVIAGELYTTLNYEEHPQESIQATLTMLTGRVQMLRGNPPALDRAEQRAIQLLIAWQNGNRLQANQKTVAVQQLATLLRIHTERYVAPNADAEDRTIAAETIQWIEQLLGQLVSSSSGALPSITSKLQEGGNDAGINMQIELIRWIGDAGSQGQLNTNPWNVPVGAP